LPREQVVNEQRRGEKPRKARSYIAINLVLFAKAQKKEK